MTKRTWILLAVLFVLALFAPLARPMDKISFQREVEHYAKQFNYSAPGRSYNVTLVDLEFFQNSLTQVPAFAYSLWDDRGEFRAWVLSDRGLDQLADVQKLPHLSGRQKSAVQRKAIVREFVHGWGIDSKGTTVALTSNDFEAHSERSQRAEGLAQDH